MGCSVSRTNPPSAILQSGHGQQNANPNLPLLAFWRLAPLAVRHARRFRWAPPVEGSRSASEWDAEG